MLFYVSASRLNHLRIFLAVAYTAYVLLRQRRSLNNFAAEAGLLCFALLEVFDSLALENPDNYLAWKKLSLICESLLPLFWFAFCATSGCLGRSDRCLMKYELIGVGTLLARSIFLLSMLGLLYRSLDMPLLPVRSLAMAILADVPL